MLNPRQTDCEAARLRPVWHGSEVAVVTSREHVRCFIITNRAPSAMQFLQGRCAVDSHQAYAVRTAGVRARIAP